MFNDYFSYKNTLLVYDFIGVKKIRTIQDSFVLKIKVPSEIMTTIALIIRVIFRVIKSDPGFTL